MFKAPASVAELPTVDQLVAIADEKVAGLDSEKRRIALLLRRHMVSAVTNSQVKVPNLLVLGPSGGGKTFLLTVMLSACPLIWTEASATEYSDVGYMGRDLVSMYAPLLSSKWRGIKGADETFHTQREMIDLAQRFGVVLLDEFDKLRITGEARPGKKKGGGSGATRDVGRVLQAELLKLVEGTEMEMPIGGRPVDFHTHHVLHIAMGAFEGLPELIHEVDNEIHGEPADPPTPAELENLHMEVDPYDIMRYGFMQELVGRFSNIVPLPSLNVAALHRILREHVIPSYRAEMEAEGIGFAVEDGAGTEIASKALRTKIGARALVPEVERHLWRRWSEAKPGDEITLRVAGATGVFAELHRREVA